MENKRLKRRTIQDYDFAEKRFYDFLSERGYSCKPELVEENYFDEFYEWLVSKNFSFSTIATYLSSLKNCFYMHEKESDFIIKLNKLRKYNNKKHKQLSPTEKYFCLPRNIAIGYSDNKDVYLNFNQAVIEKLKNTNMIRLNSFSSKKDKVEVSKMVIFLLAYYYGLKKSEIINLTTEKLSKIQLPEPEIKPNLDFWVQKYLRFYASKCSGALVFNCTADWAANLLAKIGQELGFPKKLNFNDCRRFYIYALLETRSEEKKEAIKKWLKISNQEIERYELAARKSNYLLKNK